MSNARLLTVWSTAGSPGKTTLAISISAELALAGKTVLLVDADTYAPSIALQLGLTDHPAGIAAACRLVAQQRFDRDELLRLTAEVPIGAEGMRVMTGLSSPSRWAEVGAEKLDELLMIAGEHFDFVVIDVASTIEADLFCNTSSVSRNSVTRWALEYSDQVIAICGADPISISRYLAAMANISELSPKGELVTVVNRMRTSVLGLSAKQQVSQTLNRLGGQSVSVFIPDDAATADAAIKGGYPISLGKRSSQARQAISIFVKTAILQEINQLDRRVAKLV